MEVDSGYRFGPGLSGEALFKLDVPERLIHSADSGFTVGHHWNTDETSWMQKELEPLFGLVSTNDIRSFLVLNYVHKFDIPYIAMYQKDFCSSLFVDPEQPEEEKYTVKWYRILWAIQELHNQWMLLHEQKIDLRVHYIKRFGEESGKELVHNETLMHSIIRSLEAAGSERELKDVNNKFNLHFPSGEGQAAIDISGDAGVIRAKNQLLTEYGMALFNKVSVAPPYQRNETAPPRVMACCWGPGDPATTIVMLDSCGEILDVLCTGPLSWESLTWTVPFFDGDTKQRMYSDQERILKFVTDHQPDVSIIGAANMSCPWLKEQLLWVSDTMVRKSSARPLRIVYGDESLARLYENSDISSDQLPGRSGITKRAVALGRYLQNPLAMVATLCGVGREILSWKLLKTSDENLLNPDEKYAVIEQVMIDVTNQVGLDINLAINHEWLFAPLQFISGLGPQMAACLKKSLVKSGEVSSRSEFAILHGLGELVYLNAVGFFWLRLSGMRAASSSSSQFIALLEDTRIHPELYSYAEKMAQHVYGDMDLVQSIRDLPSYIQKLDIKAYAESKGQSGFMQAFCFIREELIHGFKDWRKKYEELSDAEKFYMMTGGTPDTLSEGSIVQATVRRVGRQITLCTVGAGLICSLSTEEWGGTLNVGDTVTCKIKSLRMRNWDVKLSSF